MSSTGDILYSFGLIVRRHCISKATHSQVEIVPRKISFSLFLFPENGVQDFAQARQAPCHKTNPWSQMPLSMFLPAIQHFPTYISTHYQGVMGFLLIMKPMLVRLHPQSGPLQTRISAAEWRGDTLKHGILEHTQFPICPAAPHSTPRKHCCGWSSTGWHGRNPESCVFV